ncbi:MAG: SDR family NAD(P)-dependent oxidoreductase [Myxococcales bacterium]|nr:SDR family NAD(P)-dependent oxidoreductase [Myxococcales bacterium]
MKDQIVVITGARRGLGFATARALAEKGATVILTARSAEAAHAAAETLRAEGLNVHGEALDVSDAQSVAEAFDRIEQRFGGVDVLINNAGTFKPGVGVDELIKALDDNVIGAWRTAMRVLPGMSARGFGRIVNVSSGMGALTDMGPGYPAYRISKAAMNAATIQLQHLAGAGVKVNAVCPGWVRTDMGGANAEREIDEGIAGIVWAATLGKDGPAGGFFRDGNPIDW